LSDPSKKGGGLPFNRVGVTPVLLEDLNMPYIHMCYGWGFAYRKKVWSASCFKALDIFEDRAFIIAAKQNFQVEAYEMKAADCFHSVHVGSSSACYPQFNIPDFVLHALSPMAFEYLCRLRAIARNSNPKSPFINANG